MTKKAAAPKITPKVADLLRERLERLTFVEGGEAAIRSVKARVAVIEEILGTMDVPLDTPVPDAEPANRAEMRSRQRAVAKQHKKAVPKKVAAKRPPMKKRAPRG